MTTLKETDPLNSPLVEVDFGLWEQELESDADAPVEATPEVEKPKSRLERISERLGFYSALSTVTANEAVSKVSSKMHEFADAEAERDAKSPRRAKIKRWLARTAIATGVLVGSAITLTAHAKTGILNGGRGDTGSGWLNNMTPGFGGHDNRVLINSPAQIAPVPGDTVTLNESARIGAEGTYNAVKAAGGRPVEIVGFSEGTQGAAIAANRLAAENGGVTPSNVDVALIGGPNNANSGFFNNPLVKATSPIFDAFGIDTKAGEIPAGAVSYGKPGDFWANGGSLNPVSELGKGLGTAFGGTHGYSTAELMNPLNTSFVGEDGVTYVTVHDPLSGYGHAAQANGMLWSPEAERFVDAIGPEGEIGKSAPQPNLIGAVSAAADLAESTAKFYNIPLDIPNIPDFQIPAPLPVENAPAGNGLAGQVQNFVEQFNVPAPAPVEAAPVPAPMPNPVEQWTAPVQDFVEQWTTPTPAEVAAEPAYVPPVFEQVEQVFDNFVPETPAAQPVAPVFEQASQVVNDFATNNNLGNLQSQANDVFGQFLKH